MDCLKNVLSIIRNTFVTDQPHITIREKLFLKLLLSLKTSVLNQQNAQVSDDIIQKLNDLLMHSNPSKTLEISEDLLADLQQILSIHQETLYNS